MKQARTKLSWFFFNALLWIRQAACWHRLEWWFNRCLDLQRYPRYTHSLWYCPKCEIMKLKRGAFYGVSHQSK